MRIIKHWVRVPGEVVISTFSEVFKTQLDEVLSNLSAFRVDSALSRRLDRMTS